MEEKTNKSLYNITDDFLQLMREIEESDGEISEESNELLSINQNNLESKLRNYFYFNQKCNRDLDYINSEIERLKSKQESIVKKQERLSENLKVALKTFGTQNKSGNYVIEYPDFKIMTRKSEKTEYNKLGSSQLLNDIILDKIDIEQVKELDSIIELDINCTGRLSNVNNIRAKFADAGIVKMEVDLNIEKPVLKDFAKNVHSNVLIDKYFAPHIVETEKVNFK